MDHMAIATHTVGRYARLWVGKPVDTNGVETTGTTAEKPTNAPNVSAHHTLRVEDGATHMVEDGIIVKKRAKE